MPTGESATHEAVDKATEEQVEALADAPAAMVDTAGELIDAGRDFLEDVALDLQRQLYDLAARIRYLEHERRNGNPGGNTHANTSEAESNASEVPGPEPTQHGESITHTPEAGTAPESPPRPIHRWFRPIRG